MSQTNPCLTCGACCAHFRVSFYWGEADPAQGGTVPPDLTEDLTDFRRCMKGTDQKHPRCAALLGEIGSSVRCTIYEGRPSPCREFGVDWDEDHLRYVVEDLDRCTRARAAFGLPPLTDLPYHTPSTDDQTPPIIHAA
ncbi:YkgJ family cysteine cluster protein [Aggregatilinea lenta]|uniref:YkgJ family cysteine cluster protein n=1 Tax=Aggregatilinea lenta TaxID=913108 RepID=UPI000E5B629E|nr:YkgJ family cysteine cluster protein [Aggregatilinea lenta]